MLEFLLPQGLLSAEPGFWYAIIGDEAVPARGYDGIPRAAEEGAATCVVMLEPAGEGIEGGAFVARYSASLGYISDAWFASREAAIEDIVAEFGEEVGPLTPVPDDESDPEAYVLRAVGGGAR